MPERFKLVLLLHLAVSASETIKQAAQPFVESGLPDFKLFERAFFVAIV